MTNGSNSWDVTYSRITFLETVLKSNGNVESYKRDQDILFTLHRRKPNDVIRLLCADEYAFGVALIYQAIAEFGALNIIFVGGNWHGYTVEAKEYAIQNQIGLFNASELSGALRSIDYWNFVRKDKEGHSLYQYKSDR